MQGTSNSNLILLDSDFDRAPKVDAKNEIHRPSLSYWQDAWIRLKANRRAFVSLHLIVLLLAFTLLGPVLWRVDPSQQDLAMVSQAPSISRRAFVLPDDDAKPLEGLAKKAEGTAGGEMELAAIATTQGVAIRWSAVDGATGYALYRRSGESAGQAAGRGGFGVPMAEIAAEDPLLFEDKMNLEEMTYTYTLIPMFQGEEGDRVTSISVPVLAAVSLEYARALEPSAQQGSFISLPIHPLGTDYLGRDLLARVMAGARVSLFIGIFGPLLFTLLGMVIGGVAGYHGGRIDLVLSRTTDFFLALPFLLFMILFRVAMGIGPGESGVTAMVIALVALSWTGPARLTRGQVMQLRESEYVLAAKMLGGSSLYLIARHLVPNTIGVLLVSLTFSIPSAIFTEAFLSFIGMGVVPPTPSWGSMCNDGIQRFLSYPHEFIVPAFLISVTVLAFNLLGDGLRDALDPKMRSVS